MVAVIVALLEPLKEADPDKSPDKDIVLGVCNVVAVAALPVMLSATIAPPLFPISTQNES
jgi:hypothetical protein